MERHPHGGDRSVAVRMNREHARSLGNLEQLIDEPQLEGIRRYGQRGVVHDVVPVIVQPHRAIDVRAGAVGEDQCELAAPRQDRKAEILHCRNPGDGGHAHKSIRSFRGQQIAGDNGAVAFEPGVTESQRICAGARDRCLYHRPTQFECGARSAQAFETVVVEPFALQVESTPVRRPACIGDEQMRTESVAVRDQRYELRPVRGGVSLGQHRGKGGKYGRGERQGHRAQPRVTTDRCRAAGQSPGNRRQFVQEPQ